MKTWESDRVHPQLRGLGYTRTWYLYEDANGGGTKAVACRKNDVWEVMVNHPTISSWREELVLGKFNTLEEAKAYAEVVIKLEAA